MTTADCWNFLPWTVCVRPSRFVHSLQDDGSFVECDRSWCFPRLPLEPFAALLDAVDKTDQTTWLRTFRDWVSATILRP